MRTIILCLIFSILLSGCRNRTKSETQGQEAGIVLEQNKDIIDSTIISSIKDLAQNNTQFELGNVPLDSISFALIFYDGSDKNMLFITFYDTRTYKLDVINSDYRGSANIDGYTILVFDRNNIGHSYYDAVRLTYIPLSEIYKPSLYLSVVDSFYIEETGLRRKNPM